MITKLNPQTRLRISIAGGVLGAVLAASGCSSTSDQKVESKPTAEESEDTGFLHVDAQYISYFDTVEDIVRLSDEVVIGTVQSERRGVETGNEDLLMQMRILTVAVERVIKGSPPSLLEVETIGWAWVNGRETQVVLEDSVRLSVGDRVVMALTDSDGDGLRGANSSQSFFVLEDDRVEQTDRNDLVVRQVEAMSEEELIFRLVSAR